MIFDGCEPCLNAIFRFFVHYLAPLFGFGSWIVFITFLHHHDNEVPWYADDKWDYVRGNYNING